MYRAAVLTVSDRVSRGERPDEGGPLVAELLKNAGYEVVRTDVVPDEQAQIEAALRQMADGGNIQLLVTTGGTGFAPRDVTPEATLAVCDRLTPGIPEAMRYASMQITSRAMLSRALAGIRKGTLILNLPGSPKAAQENLEAVLPAISHGLEMLSGRPADASGTCVTCVMEGARPVLAEVQALLAPCAGARPLRSSNGFDYNRAAMLLAVLEKRGSLKVSQCDAYLNIIGGLTLDEPAADLAAVVAIASSYLDKPVPGTMAAVGEVGLSGEIRSITHMEQRLSEVRRLGFTQCMVPAHKVKDLKAPAGLELLPVENISRALRLLAQGK